MKYMLKYECNTLLDLTEAVFSKCTADKKQTKLTTNVDIYYFSIHVIFVTMT